MHSAGGSQYVQGAPPYPTQPAYPTQPQYPYQPAPYAAQPLNEYPPAGAYQHPPQYGYNQPPYQPPKADPPPPVLTVSGENSSEAGIPSFGFSEKSIRQAFVRKVFSILALQLAFTVGLTALFIFEPNVNHFVQRNFACYISAYITFIVLYIVLVCCPSVRRSWPTNIILLSIFTIVLAYMVAVISSFHETKIVLMAAGICTGSCLGIIVFSFHTKFDFTTCGGALFIMCWVLFLFGILSIFTYNNILQTVYAALGAMLFMAFLAFDTQMIMGGKKYQLSPEEHIFAALQLYLDVIYIFLFILALMGGTKK